MTCGHYISKLRKLVLPKQDWGRNRSPRRRETSHTTAWSYSLPWATLSAVDLWAEETTIPIPSAAVKNFRGLYSTHWCVRVEKSFYLDIQQTEVFLPAFSTVSWEVGTGPHVEVAVSRIHGLLLQPSPGHRPLQGWSRTREGNKHLPGLPKTRFKEISQFSTVPEDHSVLR